MTNREKEFGRREKNQIGNMKKCVLNIEEVGKEQRKKGSLVRKGEEKADEK